MCNGLIIIFELCFQLTIFVVTVAILNRNNFRVHLKKQQWNLCHFENVKPENANAIIKTHKQQFIGICFWFTSVKKSFACNFNILTFSKKNVLMSAKHGIYTRCPVWLNFDFLFDRKEN